VFQQDLPADFEKKLNLLFLGLLFGPCTVFHYIFSYRLPFCIFVGNLSEVGINVSQTDQRQSALIDWINQHTPFQCQQLETVSGDASFRRYFRFHDQGRAIIAVDAPPAQENSQIFAQVAKAYQGCGLPVPAILAADFALGFYCQDDFGNTLFADALTAGNCQSLYSQALDHLPAIQACVSTEAGSLPGFDDALLNRESELFSHWLVKIHLDLSLSVTEEQAMQQAFVTLGNNFKEQPQLGVHRDYHSRNLMILPQQTIGIIDFQDAVIGPITYDAASLLRDCYQDWPDAMVYGLLKDWHSKYYAQYDWLQFKRWFDLSGIQRHVKASGIFARLWHRDGKSVYLQDIPRTLQHLVNVSQHYAELSDFTALVNNKIKPAVEFKLQCA
jgi:aminoglycoside/choline kinase family phosphotransferase